MEYFLSKITKCNVYSLYRVDKVSTNIGSSSRLIATDDWLIKTNCYSVQVLPMQHTLVVIEGAFKHNLSRGTGTSNQTLRLRTRVVTNNFPDVTFR